MLKRLCCDYYRNNDKKWHFENTLEAFVTEITQYLFSDNEELRYELSRLGYGIVEKIVRYLKKATYIKGIMRKTLKGTYDLFFKRAPGHSRKK